MTAIALVTAAEARSRDPDLPLLVDALAARALASAIVDWDDASVNWGAFDLAVVRSTWDYARQRDRFLAWADAVASVTAIANPVDVLRWNTDKRYLRELEAAGIPIVPTTWLEPGDEPKLPESSEYVVKPAVSAGAKDTARYGDEDATHALEHMAALLAARRTVMLQPYVAEVDRAGETGLVFIAGEYSHSIRKGPILTARSGLVGGLFAEEEISPREPSRAERELAERTLSAVPGGRERLLYARVDVVTDAGSEPMLLELEVTEPSLFLDQAAGSADRLASAIVEGVRSGASQSTEGSGSA